MKILPLPTFSVSYAAEVCASGMSIVERAEILREAIPTFAQAEANYLQLGKKSQLYTLAQSDFVTPRLNGKLMGVIYKSHFAKAGSPSRSLYDRIKMSAPHDTCPLCGQRNVASVDHYMPQSAFPVLNLTPANLVPACSDCNKSKLAAVPGSEEEQMLHPYFDDLGDDRWLVAGVSESQPPTVTFSIRPAPAWPPALSSRVSGHFKRMGLAKLYAAQAASELADIAFTLGKIGQAGGAPTVRAHLHSEFESRCTRDHNSWKTALYEALKDSAWFCEGGYSGIR